MATRLRRSAAVALLVASACTGAEPASERSVAPTPSESPPPGRPQRVRAEQPKIWSADADAWAVTVSWRAPTGDVPLVYDVARDGRRVADDVDGSSFTDDRVEPGSRYRYVVVAIDEDGRRSPPAVVGVTTGEPPLGDARLDGRFVLKLNPTSQYGLQGSARGAPAQATFVPVCGAGACDVTWSVQGENGGGRLDREDGRYSGTGSSTFRIASCGGGGGLTETVAIDVRVTEAEVRKGAWRAVAVSGTLRESVPSTGGCVSAGITWAVTGTLLA